jgi:tubulin polyglutamylase TTLL5
LLLDGCKFDVRLFVLVTSWHPLVVYLFDDGIARCAGSCYSLDGPLNAQPTAHFTNSSISSEGHRHMMPELRARLEGILGVEGASHSWDAVDDLVVKMMLTVEGRMAAELRAASLRTASGHPNTSCFELFGIDVMFGADGKPWLLEANLDPSLSTEDIHGTLQGANAHLKSRMLAEMFNIVGVCLPPPELPTRGRQQAEAEAEAVAAAAAAQGSPDLAAVAAAEYARVALARRLSVDQVKAATLRHVDAEGVRAHGTGWRRLLPSDRSTHYAQFIGKERRELNLLAFAPIASARRFNQF